MTTTPQGALVHQRKRIAILTAASLSWNPRALKDAQTLAAADFEVVVYGTAPDDERQQADEVLAQNHGFMFKSVLPRGNSFQSRLASTWCRTRKRLGEELHKYLRCDNSWQLGTSVVELMSHAKQAKADLYLAHLEQAAWVGAQLLRSGSRVGIDMEDWYSEDLPAEARKSRPSRLLRDVERELLVNCVHTTCPSRAMSQALASEFGCAPPAVVYNAFPWTDRKYLDGQLKDRKDKRSWSIHWFSQTLGPDRGLQDLFSALPLLKHEAEIHLRGNPTKGFEGWFANQVPESWRRRIVIHGLVPNTELLSRIAEHDIGFAGEMKYCRSRDLTVTNKILQYLLAGIAVVASDTAGQREVAEKASGAVSLYPSGDAHALAAQLDHLMSSVEILDRAKAAALSASERTFCWECQEKVLLESVERALHSGSSNERRQVSVPA